MDTPSFTALVLLAVDGPDLPVRGVLRSTGDSPAGWFAWAGGGGRPAVTGAGPDGDRQVCRDGAGLRIATTDGRPLLVADAAHTWSFPDDGSAPVRRERHELVVAGRGTQLLFRRTLHDLAAPSTRYEDYLPRHALLRPTGPVEAVTVLDRPAWAVDLEGDRPHRLVVDATTGLVLRESWSEPDALDEWLELTVGEPVDPSLLTWDGPTVEPVDPEEHRAAAWAAEQVQQQAWVTELLGPDPVPAEIDLRPAFVHERDADGGFQATLGEHLGLLARRPRSDAPWALGWSLVVHRWSTARWDWAVSVHDGALTPAGLAALQVRLADRA